MEKIIASCGLNCSTCDARIATLNDDNELRAKTADAWKVMFNAPDISIEMINCTGCREEGVNFAHCQDCEIRNCVISNNFKTCAECSEIDSCLKLMNITQYAPEAMDNLKSLFEENTNSNS